ncbi:hypothetical protein RIF29_40674 [Crotalaria pallida]|uniref:Transcription factor CBF/NF-Y/archaeal histone domain-containing protein n=1 Tax=Crotalaria pallida TaxID=3830 RepID=A0AAN9HRW6_CROPI
MDPNQQWQQTRVAAGTPNQSYVTNLHAQPNNMVIQPIHPPTHHAIAHYNSSSSSYPSVSPYASPYILKPSPHQQELQQRLNNFWAKQYHEIMTTTDFKSHKLPLTRIKRVMKSNEEVSMVSGEVPIFFAKACEMFISELTMKAWANTDENKRRTLQKEDIAAAIERTEVFDFLAHVVSNDDDDNTEEVDHHDDVYAVGMSREGKAPIENDVTYYYPPPPQQVPSGIPYNNNANASRVAHYYGQQQAHSSSSGALMWPHQQPNHFPKP